ncbi:MAG: sugar phosphate isomerase/epimerase [Acidobacteria bacterium]|nr:MAG: sugar phosphate isomerase/epimerase [Acidobacteriota bacterium]
MSTPTHRRRFLSAILGTAALAAAAPLHGRAKAQGRVARSGGNRVRLGLNAYSFNEPLRAGTLTLDDLVDYCAQQGLDGLDATGYYFPGYPKVPEDAFLYRLKRRAFVNGVTICGTGVRNDFAVDDPTARQRDVRMVKDWIEAAAKLGANVVRIFSGLKVPDGGTFERTLEWMVPDIKACVDHGREHGVIVGLQNHNDFVKTADETIRIVRAVNSEWFGVILDVGSLRQGDPYAEIEKLVPYAVTWQLKENVWYGGKEVPADVGRIKAIIDKAGYRGFLPIETLGPGDPRVKVARFLAEVRRAFGSPASVGLI